MGFPFDIQPDGTTYNINCTSRVKSEKFCRGVPARCLAKEDAEHAGRFGGLEPATVTAPDRAVAPGPARQITRGLAGLAHRYRQTDRCPWLADTAACLHGVSPLEGRRSVNCQVCFCPILSHFQIPIEQIMRLQSVCRNALTSTDLNGQGNAFSLQRSRISRK